MFSWVVVGVVRSTENMYKRSFRYRAFVFCQLGVEIVFQIAGLQSERILTRYRAEQTPGPSVGRDVTLFSFAPGVHHRVDCRRGSHTSFSCSTGTPVVVENG